MTNKPNGTLYIGVTADLSARAHQHRSGQGGGFTRKYGLDRLVCYEEYDDITQAIQRETSLKRWYRDWKIALIETMNPDWRDLDVNLH